MTATCKVLLLHFIPWDFHTHTVPLIATLTLLFWMRKCLFTSFFFFFSSRVPCKSLHWVFVAIKACQMWLYLQTTVVLPLFGNGASFYFGLCWLKGEVPKLTQQFGKPGELLVMNGMSNKLKFDFILQKCIFEWSHLLVADILSDKWNILHCFWQKGHSNETTIKPASKILVPGEPEIPTYPDWDLSSLLSHIKRSSTTYLLI